MTYLKKILIALDQLINAVLLGWPDETLSSRAYRWRLKGVCVWPSVLIDTLFFWDESHCKASYVSERTDRHLPPEMRS